MPKIFFYPRAEKMFSRFSKREQERIAKTVAQMAITPFESLNIEKFQTGYGKLYRIRLGSLRIVFEFDSKTETIYIITIDYRGNIY